MEITFTTKTVKGWTYVKANGKLIGFAWKDEDHGWTSRFDGEDYPMSGFSTKSAAIKSLTSSYAE